MIGKVIILQVSQSFISTFFTFKVGKEAFLELGTFSKDNYNGLREELVFRVISFLSISRSPEMATPATVRRMNSANAREFNAMVRMLLKNTDAWKAKRRREIEQSIAEELKRRETKIPNDTVVKPKVVTDEDSISQENDAKPDQSTEKVSKMTSETMSELPDCSKTEIRQAIQGNVKENVPSERSCASSDCSNIGIQLCAGCHRSLYCGQVCSPIIKFLFVNELFAFPHLYNRKVVGLFMCSDPQECASADWSLHKILCKAKAKERGRRRGVVKKLSEVD